jgi:hypothetical protein
LTSCMSFARRLVFRNSGSFDSKNGEIRAARRVSRAYQLSARCHTRKYTRAYLHQGETESHRECRDHSYGVSPHQWSCLSDWWTLAVLSTSWCWVHGVILGRLQIGQKQDASFRRHLWPSVIDSEILCCVDSWSWAATDRTELDLLVNQILYSNVVSRLVGQENNGRDALIDIMCLLVHCLSFHVTQG